MSPSQQSNDDLLADALDYLSYLLGLIETQDWNRFEDFALKNPNTFRFISKSIQECAEFNGMTLLHACVRYNPPIKLLEQMIKLYPRALQSEDCLGRTPLHVAAGSGANPWVVKALVLNYPEACNIQDEDGRTPLHFACDTSCELFEDDLDCVPRGPPNLNTVRFLLAGSLEAVSLEDVDEMNAVEYAIVSDAPMEVVNLLQRATQRVMKTRSSCSDSSDDESRAQSPTSSMARIRVH